jgi:hypothetical protein
MLEFENYYMNIFHGIIQNFEIENKKAKRTAFFEKYDITTENDLLGSKKLNIPFKYALITQKENHIHCYHANEAKIDVYDTEGNFILFGIKIQYLGMGILLVQTKEDTKQGNQLSQLYDQKGNRLSKTFYGSNMFSKFSDYGFCILRKKGKTIHSTVDVVVNMKGNEVYVQESYDSIYITGVLVHSSKIGYVNLLDGSTVCKKGYNSTSTSEFLFVCGHNVVHQINLKTGECKTFE